MYTRLLTFTGAKDIEGGIAFVRDKVLPILHEQKGYRGLTISTDRSAGVLAILSLWETEKDRDASEQLLANARQEGLSIVGGTLKVETFEELLADISQPPVPGSALMVTRISMDPLKIDENFNFFKSDVLPRIRANPGYMALRNMVNRQTGEGIVGALWRDESAMKAAATEAESRRPVAIARGVNFVEVVYREFAFADLP